MEYKMKEIDCMKKKNKLEKIDFGSFIKIIIDYMILYIFIGMV